MYFSPDINKVMGIYNVVNCLSTLFVRVNPTVSFIYIFVYYGIEITPNYEGFFIMIIDELF